MFGIARPFPRIELIASDMDGTMLDSGTRIPEKNRLAVADAIRSGVAVTISTGRMYKSALAFAERLGIREVPLICYNGSIIRRTNGETLSHVRLDMDVARGLLDIFRERGIYVQSYIDDELYVRDFDDQKYIYYYSNFGTAGKSIGDGLYAPETPPTKLLAMTSGLDASRDLMRELSEIFGDRLYVTTSNADFVEMMNPEASKGKCLRKLADILGVSMENVMALGDGDNDAEMIKMAGIGVAMANARNSAKLAADVIAPSNDECGVAWAIEKYVLADRV
ncbi:MAG: Cof-type HAD-IIB family hydrolase [Synergistaceae bacterium]|jgi:Cof subfamily protein (haloacid dehalogenase superfamily)|nr:Cof-type HAD-IIB family hydrolase [Synergistaceae bacterium]